jgi:hypothetical protein
VEVQVPDSLNHLRGEARLFFSDILQPATHAEVVGAHTLAFAAGGTWPLTSWFNLDADLEIAWWKRGVTLAELNAGVVRNYPGRAIVAAFGMDFVPVRWRILQLVGNVMPIRVSLVDLASSTQGQYRLGHKYDGFDVFLGVGGDIPVSSSQARGLDLRGGLLLGGHRALHSDGIPFYYGSQFSVAYLW